MAAMRIHLEMPPECQNHSAIILERKKKDFPPHVLKSYKHLLGGVYLILLGFD